MAFDDVRVYGYQDRATFRRHGVFQAAKIPERITPAFAPKPGQKLSRAARRRLKLKVQRAMKYAVDWHSGDLPIYARAMVLTDTALLVAGPPTFDEKQAVELLKTVPTDNAELPPVLAASDNCDDNVDVDYQETVDHGSQTYYRRTWTATDECGNVAT